MIAQNGDCLSADNQLHHKSNGLQCERSFSSIVSSVSHPLQAVKVTGSYVGRLAYAGLTKEYPFLIPTGLDRP
eukprot:5698605-Amphidinium_carterae.1